MPSFSRKQRRGKDQSINSSGKSPQSDNKSKGSGLSRSVSGGGTSEEMFERHAALLGDQRMSHPANASQRADIVRQIQRDYGNSYVQRLVDHVSSQTSGGIQAKLEVGAADDKYEREADKIAKAVMKNVHQDVGDVDHSASESAQRKQEESSISSGSGVNDFERLVGAMGIMVDAFNKGAWSAGFAGNLDPSMVLVNKLLTILGSQKSLNNTDQMILTAVNQFAGLAIKLQSTAKGGENVSGAIPDLNSVLELVKYNSNLLDAKGKKALMSWLPKGVDKPPSDAVFGGPSGQTQSDSMSDSDSDNYNNFDLDDNDNDNYNNIPVDPSANYNNFDFDDNDSDNYNNIPVDPSANYNNLDFDDNDNDNYNNIPVDPSSNYNNIPTSSSSDSPAWTAGKAPDGGKKEESPYGVPIFVDDKDDDEKKRKKMGGHRRKK